MSTQSAKEIKQEYIEKMGPELGKIFYSIRNDLILLTDKWNEFETLYTIKTRVKLFNHVAPFFSFLVQNIMWENLILSIARLIDPKESTWRKTISFQTIPEYIVDGNLKNKINLRIQNLIEIGRFSKDWRNRKIAHKEFDLIINDEKAKPLETIKINSIKEFLAEFHTFLNEIDSHYLNSTTIYTVIERSGGALALLYKIEEGIRFDKLNLEMKKKGDWSLENYKSVI